MTFDELLREILKILPNAQVDEDEDGQLIVYTNKVVDADDEVREMP